MPVGWPLALPARWTVPASIVTAPGAPLLRLRLLRKPPSAEPRRAGRADRDVGTGAAAERLRDDRGPALDAGIDDLDVDRRRWRRSRRGCRRG